MQFCSLCTMNLLMQFKLVINVILFTLLLVTMYARQPNHTYYVMLHVDGNPEIDEPVGKFVASSRYSKFMFRLIFLFRFALCGFSEKRLYFFMCI